MQDKVILWTRLTPVDFSAPLKVTWEIATDDQFKQNLKTGTVQTTKTDDFTVKVDATGLQAGTTYYYRFRFGSKFSPVGQTKTLPVTTNRSASQYVLVLIILQVIFTFIVKWQNRMWM